MSKIIDDKYYTPIAVANHCWDKVADVIGMGNISEIVEPSCGNGAFFHHPKYLPHFGYDIKPEMNQHNIIMADYLVAPICYLPGRLIIGNPPYGRCMNLAQKFYKKSVEIADYIAFILPISQFNNVNSMYEFDLIYSEDLGEQYYSDVLLHCCFNIYRRPESGELNKRPSHKLKSVSFCRQDSKGYAEQPYDVCLCYWGNGSCGNIVDQPGTYSAEYKIKVNDIEHRDEIINFIKTYNWREYVNCIAAKKLQQFHILDMLKDKFDWIK